MYFLWTSFYKFCWSLRRNSLYLLNCLCVLHPHSHNILLSLGAQSRATYFSENQHFVKIDLTMTEKKTGNSFLFYHQFLMFPWLQSVVLNWHFQWCLSGKIQNFNYLRWWVTAWGLHRVSWACGIFFSQNRLSCCDRQHTVSQDNLPSGQGKKTSMSSIVT